MRTFTTRLAAVLLSAGLAVAVVAGCSGSSPEATSAARDGSGENALKPEQPQPQAKDDSGAQKESDESKNRARTAITERAIIRTGKMTVSTKDVQLAADKASALVNGSDGFVGNIDTMSNDKGQTVGIQLVLRVPVEDYDAVVAGVKKLGKVTANQHQSTDVTKELTDVESRIASQKKSIERLRTLMGQANTVGDVIQVETELATREADLESLQSQQATLSAQATLSTLSVNFERPEKAAPAPAGKDTTGFLQGLQAGWKALVATVDVALTVLGALLPFALGIAVLGAVPAWLLIRQRNRRRVTPTPAAATAAGSGGES